jgi:hypothetical protein
MPTLMVSLKDTCLLPISVWNEARGTAGFAALKPVQGKVNLCERAGDRYLFALGLQPAGRRAG